MPKVFTSKTQKIGELGEDIACKYLTNKGFTVVERNYTKKWGEIDVIAEKAGKLYFIEVKSVSCETFDNIVYRPEDNLHPIKMRKLFRAVQTYLMRKNGEVEWQVDLYCVYIQLKDRMARVKVLENIIV